MSDVVEFLRARLDEDEAVARAATAGPWSSQSSTQVMPPAPWRRQPWHHNAIVDAHYGDLGQRARDTAHIARHDPARVLREVKAKRALVVAHGTTGRKWVGFPRADRQVTYCRGCEQEAPCFTLLTLASVYAGQPDYDPDWSTP